MATTIDRTHYNTLVDDDGSGTTGSIWDKADVDAILDNIDSILANPVTFGSSIAERNRSFAIGVAQTVAHSAGNFTGSGSMTWTVEAADHVAFRYFLVGTTMWVIIDVRNTTVGGTPSSALQIAIPGSMTPLFDNQSMQAIRVKNNGTFAWGYALVRNTGAGIQIFCDVTGTTNWTASTNNTDVFGVIGPFAAS